MTNQPNVLNFRNGFTFHVGPETNLAQAPREDVGDPTQMRAHPPVTDSHLATQWVICVQSGALTMQWWEA